MTAKVQIRKAHDYNYSAVIMTHWIFILKTLSLTYIAGEKVTELLPLVLFMDSV